MSNVVDRLYGVRSSQALKVPCRVATTANITLSGLQTINGVTLVELDRVLVKNQDNAVENGIYLAKATAWVRAPDWDGYGDVITGTLVLVNEGTLNATSGWRVSTPGVITINETGVSLVGPLGTIGIEVTVSEFIRTLLDDADQNAARTTLGVGVSNSPRFDGVNVGHDSDTALTRSAAGKLDVAGHTVVTDDEEDQGPITGGAGITPKALGTAGVVSSGTLTVDVRDRAMQEYQNNGAHALDVGANTGSTVVKITNGASAGAINTSAFNVVRGNAFTTTNGHVFRCAVEYWGSGNKWLFIERIV